MKMLKQFALITAVSSLAFGQLFINEVDYDQEGTDAAEYFELAGPAGTYNTVTVDLINGNGGTSYRTVDLGNITLANESSGYGFYVVGRASIPNVDTTPSGWPDENAIQNGAPDGIVLKVGGSIVDAVAYEGDMNDADGNPMESADGDYAGADSSMYRVGLDGSNWVYGANSPGTINTGQTFVPAPVFGTLTQTPATPNETESANICVVVTDPDGTVSSVVLSYTVDGGSAVEVTFGPVYCGENTWGGVIPAQPAGSVVAYTITATDNDSNTTQLSSGYTVMSSAGQTIYDIQYTSTAAGECYDSPLFGQTVTFSGIITASGSGNYYIQDGSGAWNGVYVYDSGNSVARGDSVTLVAEVDEYYGMTEIKGVSSFTVTSSENEEPAAVSISTGDLAGGCSLTGEAYEGVLVTVTNVTVTAAADQYGQWWVDDGSGACEVEDKYFEHSPTVGDVIPSLTGVVEYGFSEYALCPRDANDFGSPVSFENESAAPEFVTSSSEITISIDIVPTDTVTISTASIQYGTDGSMLNTSEMWLDSGNNWQGIIPAQAGNSLLSYQVEAVTGGGSAINSYTYELPVASTQLTGISTIQDNPVSGDIVTVEGVVTIGSGLLQTGLTNAYMQDGSGRGINLFNYDVLTLERGDKVTVVGEVEIYYTTIEIKNFAYKLVSTGNALPDPVQITPEVANQALWEGTWIQLMGIVADTASYGGGITVDIADGADTAAVRIWSSTGVDVSKITIGENWAFNGVESQYQNIFQLLVAYDDDVLNATSVDGGENVRPLSFGLNPAYPNPFNPSTTISWRMDQHGDYSLTVFDVMGREIEQLAQGTADAGSYSMNWDASHLSSGVYFLQLKSATGSSMQKVMLLK
ncbi:MAG: T9SS type A sorting domain-containing protein [Candidatus Marinimicrobia bacterium]|nr:T9SS type A sorting domain-containing protein [Candidatus Neomarinimicrobiota bacterium]MCF7850882.1 T9SS type A sorting domain-containing protein [Candidatus Neomarinimicrobiota bacterium]MCF7904165.1 T9SS type A sorting domain-containing protein [Candidatus Neomarinimicrobiota bacterium]